MAAVAGWLRPAGWLVFDLHTDGMMDFTIANPVVAGTSAGNDFVISSIVDPGTPHVRHDDRAHARPVTATRSASSTGSTSTRMRMSVPPSRTRASR